MKNIYLILLLFCSIPGWSQNDKVVLVEKFTRTGCGNCPNGALRVQTFIDDYPGQVFGIYVHVAGDPMSFNNDIASEFGSWGTPTYMVDRVLFDGQSLEVVSTANMQNFVLDQLSTSAPLAMNITADYNANTREISGTLTADFADAVSGDMRFLLYVTEETVTGGAAYNQANYYNSVAGSPLEGLGNPIVGYEHKHVLRALPLGYLGLEGSVPASVNAGESITQSFSFTLPQEIDENEVRLIGSVANYGTNAGERALLNSGILDFSDMTLVAVEDPDQLTEQLNIYPNPATDVVRISSPESIGLPRSLEIHDVAGRVVFSTNESLQQDMYIQTNELGKGIFLVLIETDKGRALGKLVVH